MENSAQANANISNKELNKMHPQMQTQPQQNNVFRMQQNIQQNMQPNMQPNIHR